jgi:hypothetical protein
MRELKRTLPSTGRRDLHCFVQIWRPARWQHDGFGCLPALFVQAAGDSSVRLCPTFHSRKGYRTHFEDSLASRTGGTSLLITRSDLLLYFCFSFFVIQPVDYRCEDGRFQVSASCVTISNPDYLSRSVTVVNPVIRSWKSTHLIELDLRNPLVVSISQRSEELRLYNVV